MENIIKKAIEGGWMKRANPEIVTINGEFQRVETWGGGDSNDKTKEQIVLDYLFWQALGKVCGWENQIMRYRSEYGELEAYCDESVYKALVFHQKNLTEGWEKAVRYLQLQLI